MKIDVLPSDERVAKLAASFIATEARAAVEARGRFVLAASGGKSPWPMFRALADQDVPWKEMRVVQVDERVAPEGDPDRNLTSLRATLLEHTPLRSEQISAMPVNEPDLPTAALRYAATLRDLAGPTPVLDLVHLGLGPDGHTASLVPGDPVLDVDDVDVALTGIYQGRRRMTLTYPILNRARKILWLIIGDRPADALLRLCSADHTIPAGRIRQDRAHLFADRAAAARLESSGQS